MTVPQKLILASASPRRQILLGEAGIEFEVSVAVETEPEQHVGETPGNYARRAAVAKALYVVQSWPGYLVLGADTVVALGNHTLGKPRDAADAAQMLHRLSGRIHEVHTGVALVRLAHSGALRLHTGVTTTQVKFRRLSDAEITAYIATDEPLDKAGSYGIQGLGGALVEEISGAWDNVVGLPMLTVCELLERMKTG